VEWVIWLWWAEFRVRKPPLRVRIPAGVPPCEVCIVTREGRWRFWKDHRLKPGQRLISGPERMAAFRLALYLTG
jgi:hypothetical protein